MTSRSATYSYSPGHSRIFHESLNLDPTSLIIGGSGQSYRATSDSGGTYFVKLYEPYREHAWDQGLLSKKRIYLSNASLENCYDPWHRESRAYERIDSRIKGGSRSLFPKYYGTGSLSSSCVPYSWPDAFSNSIDVHCVVLESVEKTAEKPTATILSEVKLSEASSMMAKVIYAKTKSCQDVHVFIHFCEMIEKLHQAQIIHGDLKHDNLLDYSIAQRPVLLDFSRSWTYTDDLPCLDPFRREPRRFEERCLAELLVIREMVLSESQTSKEDQILRKKFPSHTECQRCTKLMEMITKADETETGGNY